MPFAQTAAATAPLIFGLLGGWLLGRRETPGRAGYVVAGLLLLTSAIWSQVQKEYEGPTVVALYPGRGLTIADLVLVPSLAIAVALIARTRRR